jgi:predicted SprT family Zn-dependent metalloprotease
MMATTRISAQRPTEQAYEELQRAYDWFNQRLFEATLPQCLITLQRHKRTMGYFCHERFVDIQGQRTDEIAMNPEYFAVQSAEAVLSTLVHEMVHLWQQHFGKPGRGQYHNGEWAKRMLRVGLVPSHTGQPGGKQTGDQMDHYIEPDGAFSVCCSDLLATDFRISWYDRFPPRILDLTQAHCLPVHGDGENANASLAAKGSVPALTGLASSMVVRATDGSNRTKYVCFECGAQAWGKPRLKLICGDCQVSMLPPS